MEQFKLIIAGMSQKPVERIAAGLAATSNPSFPIRQNHRTIGS